MSTKLQGRSALWLRCSLAVALCTAVLCGPSAARAAEPVNQQIGAHLAAGEFAPALKLAQGVADPAARDNLLRQVAAAQAQGGASEASWRTSAGIQSDLIRSQALGDLNRTPIGNAGGRGGFSEPDFESIIDLITRTVEPDSWAVGGGGAGGGVGGGDIAPFEGGVFVDADGVLARKLKEESTDWLARLRAESQRKAAQGDVRSRSPLRKVSLTRLERAVQLRLAAGQPIDEEMLVLAGLERVEQVFVYPDSGEIVLAGPAGNWTGDAEGRVVSADSGHPVVRLDDLVVLLRQAYGENGGRFGCSIDPVQENLAKTQAFLAESAKRPLAATTAARNRWMEQIRTNLGQQKATVYGVDSTTRVGRLLVEADYRMKLLGLGLEEGVPGAGSYLSLIDVKNGEAAPPLGLVRWWFTLNYDSVSTTPTRNAFALAGQGVQLLSENELLAEMGRRVQTGQADNFNRQFAQNFTKEFAALAKKHHVFADLQNLFDTALVCALIKAEDLPGQVGWHMTCFGDPEQYPVPTATAPQRVDTVVAHRVVNKTQILAAASGGVRVDANRYASRDAVQVDRTGQLGSEHRLAAPQAADLNVWWWD